MEQAKPKASEGLPGWVMTFADLMTLVLCFFVLLLSFSEMDLQKYKQVAGSMKAAFGVQREIKASESPKGTSIIAQEYSPGKPQPTPIKVMQQNTVDDTKQTVDFRALREAEADKLVALLQQELAPEIRDEVLDVERKEGLVIIRIREKGSFPSGSAIIQRSFVPTLNRIAGVLATVPGEIRVAGHTDDVPIATALYRSNWDLSSARAVSVVHVLLNNAGIEAHKVTAEGHADAHPLINNTDPTSRARNRRVEIVIANNPGLEQQFEFLRKGEARTQPQQETANEQQ